MLKQHKHCWTKQQIRTARQEQLAAVLQRRGLRLHCSGGDNYKITEHPGYIIKNNYWRQVETDAAGNTIDFLVKVIGMNFTQAMQEILQV